MTQRKTLAPLLSLHSVSVVTLFSMGQFVLLIGLQLLVAARFGASAQLDAYLAAYAIPLAIGGILSGTIDSALVPHYHRLVSDRGTEFAESQSGFIGFALVQASLLIAIALWFGADSVIALLYGQLTSDSGALAVSVLRITCWLVPLTTLLGFMFGIHHARGKFLMPSATSLIGPLVTVIILASVTEPSIILLAFAVTVGAIVAVIPMIRSMPGLSLRATDKRSLVAFAALAFPIAIGATYTRLNILVDRPLAAELSEGSISHLGYAWRIVEAVASIASSGLAIVAFPLLAKAAAIKRKEMFDASLAEAWQLFTVIIVPVVMGVVVCSRPILAVTFQRGAFTATDTDAVVSLLQLYTGVIFAAGIGTIGGRAFVASGRAWTPIIVGICTFAAATAAKFFVVSSYGVSGLAGVTSAHYFINSMILVSLSAFVWKSPQFQGLGMTALRSVGAACVVIGPAWMLMQFQSLLSVILAVCVAAVAYPLVLFLLNDPHACRAIGKLKGGSNE